MKTRAANEARARSRAAAASTLTNLRRIVHAIQGQSSRIESSVGLTGPQLWALREINATVGGLPLGQIARKLVLHKANAGRIVDKLVALGLVQTERPANDLRVVLARITEKGRSLAEAAVQGPAQADLMTRLERLPPDEIEAIAGTLDRVVELLGAETAEAGPLFEEGATRRSPRKRRG
ncbi:MAG TPA: MarR family transcriptional regulator [Planctomycetota bacterium]|nr:MarR family transcriptional regulator [Planctomycetota bacterium]